MELTNLGGTWVKIENEEVLQEIADATGAMVERLTELAAAAAMEDMNLTEANMPDAFKGKISVQVEPIGQGQFVVLYGTKSEPATRLVDQTVFIENEGEKPRYVTLGQRPSIDTAVAQALVTSETLAAQVISQRAGPEIMAAYVEELDKRNVKYDDSMNRFRAPAGGITVGGKFFAGGQTITTPPDLTGGNYG